MALKGRNQGTVVRRSGSFVGTLLVILVLVGALAAGGIFYLRYQEAADAPEPQVAAAPPAPAPAPKADPEPEPEPEPKPEAAAEPEPKPEPQTEAVAEPEPKPAPTTETTAPAPAVVVEKPAEPTAPAPVPQAAPTPKETKETVMAEAHPEVARAAKLLADGETNAAIGALMTLAKEGVAAGQRMLGLQYARGEGVEREPEKAVELFRAAADQMDAEAQYYLGYAYLDGMGVEADQVAALAWFMHSAANGYGPGREERDRGLAAVDMGGMIQAESKSRERGMPPFPAGWLADDKSGVEVWSPPWYRNGTFKVKVAVPAVDGKAHGEGRVDVTAQMSGRSDNFFEGTFVNGYLLDPAYNGEPPILTATGYVVHPLDAGAIGHAGVDRAWRQSELDDMRIKKCGFSHSAIYVVMRPDFAEIDDAVMQGIGVGAVQALGRICPLKAHEQSRVYLLPAYHQRQFDRGDETYEPQLAEVYVYIDSDNANPDGWSIQLKNYAKRAHEERLRKEEQERKQREREEQKRRELAAAATREMPDIRGFSLGISFDDFKAQLGDDAVEWTPKLKPGHKMPAFTDFEQKVKLADGATFTAIFASAQNDSRLMVLIYEQYIRSGPTMDQLRGQLYDKYGKPDSEAGGRTWQTWWLRSMLDNEPKGAFLKGRITSGNDGKADYLRLILNDYNLVRHDERVRVQARRQAEIDKFEEGKSDEVKF